MSNPSRQVSILLMLWALSHIMISVASTLMARPDFMPPRMFDQNRNVKRLLREIADLDLKPQSQHSRKQAPRSTLNSSLINETQEKPAIDYELICTADADQIVSSCCSLFRGSSECKPVTIMPIELITVEKPVKKVQNEIEILVANFEKKLLDEVNAKRIQREADSRKARYHF